MHANHAVCEISQADIGRCHPRQSSRFGRNFGTSSYITGALHLDLMRIQMNRTAIVALGNNKSMRNWGHQKTFLSEVLLSTDLEKQKRNKQRIEKGAKAC